MTDMRRWGRTGGPERGVPGKARQRRWGLMPLVVLLLLPACAAVFEQPEVELAGIRLAGLGISGGTVVVRLNVANPNGYALDASGLTYDVDLQTRDGDDWLNLADGTFQDAVRVEAHDSASVEIPVAFSYGGLGSALRSLMDYGTVRYRIQGRIAVRSPMRREIPYNHAGSVTVP